jgi:hypothetical protein
MNAIEGFEILLVGVGTLPLAAGIARIALNALFTLLENPVGQPSVCGGLQPAEATHFRTALNT